MMEHISERRKSDFKKYLRYCTSLSDEVFGDTEAANKPAYTLGFVIAYAAVTFLDHQSHDFTDSLDDTDYSKMTEQIAETKQEVARLKRRICRLKKHKTTKE